MLWSVRGLQQGRFMAIDFDSNPLAELSHYRSLGVDGVFVDCPSTAQQWLAATTAGSGSLDAWMRRVLDNAGAFLAAWIGQDPHRTGSTSSSWV
jgi:hypothetical protein